jgi:hypothetical protein
VQVHSAAAAIKAPHKQLHGTEVLPWGPSNYYWRYNTYTSAAQDKKVEKGTNGTATSSSVCCEWNLQQHHLLKHETTSDSHRMAT